VAKFSIGSKVIVTEDSPLNGRTGTITGVGKVSEHILYVQFCEGGAHVPVGDQEMRAATQQCKDCAGEGGSLFNGWYWERCPTCDGSGTINRTGPYRLADGTWSDGVDRSVPMGDREVGLKRWEVWRYRGGTDEWGAGFDPDDEGGMNEKYFPTHAEAITYADRMARAQA